MRELKNYHFAMSNDIMVNYQFAKTITYKINEKL